MCSNYTVLHINEYSTNIVWATKRENVPFISSYNPNFSTFNEPIMGIRDGISNSIQLQMILVVIGLLSIILALSLYVVSREKYEV